MTIEQPDRYIGMIGPSELRWPARLTYIIPIRLYLKGVEAHNRFVKAKGVLDEYLRDNIEVEDIVLTHLRNNVERARRDEMNALSKKPRRKVYNVKD